MIVMCVGVEMGRIYKRLFALVIKWLTHETFPDQGIIPLSSFERLCHEIRPGDVILVEGRSRVSEVIKMITQSPWTHSALYVGRMFDLQDVELRDKLVKEYDLEMGKPYIIEALLGEGTIIHPLEKYTKDHLRICRPKGISPADTHSVIQYAISRLGTDYDIRQLLDLARFLFPYGFLPRRWRSSLFSHNAGNQTRTVCSTMMVEAFQTVKFPILPFAEKTDGDKIHLFQRNPRLMTPKDFDFSPYFEIVKYPFFDLDDVSLYRHLPWAQSDVSCNNPEECHIENSDTVSNIDPDEIVTDDITNTDPQKITPSENITTPSINRLNGLNKNQSGESS